MKSLCKECGQRVDTDRLLRHWADHHPAMWAYIKQGGSLWQL